MRQTGGILITNKHASRRTGRWTYGQTDGQSDNNVDVVIGKDVHIFYDVYQRV